MIRFFIFLLLCCFLASLCSCSKGWEDIQITPAQQTKKVFIISKRFTSEWVYYKTVEQEIIGVGWQAYYNQKPDTIISTCSIDKRDSLFKIEIRSFDIR